MKINTISIGFSEVPNNISVLLYAQGCHHRCKGCHNSELWTFDGGFFYDDDAIREKLATYSKVCGWVCWLGGDATYQPERLREVNKICKDMGFKVSLYTGHKLSDLTPVMLEDVDMVVDGKWDSDLGGVESDTTNQKTYININGEFKEIKFSEFDEKL